MTIGKCLRCDAVGEVTRDHVVPEWLNKAFENFGNTNLKSDLIEMVCKKCNQDKGGKIDLSNKNVFEVMDKFIQHWNKKIEDFKNKKPQG